MNDEQLKHTLTQLAEDGVPADANLWPALRTRLAGARSPALAEKGFPMLKPVSGGTQPLAARTLGAVTLALLLLTAAVLVTPQGRAWAQSVWQYFTVAPADSFAVEPVLAPEAGAATAAPPSVNAEECGADLACQVRSAEALLSFTPVIPEVGIRGTTLVAVSVDADGQMLRLSYAAPQGGGLVLSQGRGPLSQSPWEEVPADAVEPVKVGAYDGEYVQGTFVVYSQSGTQAEWNPDAPIQRLRWQVGDLVFEIEKMGDPEPIEYLDRDALIALAESLQ